MFDVPINYLAILVCGVVSMFIGYLWYGPLFGKTWMALTGIKKETMTEAQKKGMGKSYFLMFIGSLVMAYVLAFYTFVVGSFLKRSGFLVGLEGGFWSWLGFIAPVTLGSVLWEGKSWKLWFIGNSYYLVLL